MKKFRKTSSIILAIAMILTSFMSIGITVSAEATAPASTVSFYDLDFQGTGTVTAPDGFTIVEENVGTDYKNYEYVSGLFGKAADDSAMKLSLAQRPTSGTTYRGGIDRNDSTEAVFKTYRPAWGDKLVISFQLAYQDTMPNIFINAQGVAASNVNESGLYVTVPVFSIGSVKPALEADKWYNIDVVVEPSDVDGNVLWDGYIKSSVYVNGEFSYNKITQCKRTDRPFGGLRKIQFRYLDSGTNPINAYVDNYSFKLYRWGTSNLADASQYPVYLPETSGVSVALNSGYTIDSGIITANNMTNGPISVSEFESGLTFTDVVSKRYYTDKTLTTAIADSGYVEEGNYLVVEKSDGDLYTYEIKDTMKGPTPPTDVKTIFDLDFTGNGAATAPEGFSFVEATAGTEYKSYEYVPGAFGKASDDSALKISLAEGERNGTMFRLGLTRDTVDTDALWNTFRPTWGDKLVYSFQIAVGEDNEGSNIFLQTKAVSTANINEGSQQKAFHAFHISNITPKIESGKWYNVEVVIEPSNEAGETVYDGASTYFKRTVYVDGVLAHQENIPTKVAGKAFGGLKETTFRCITSSNAPVEFYLDNYSFKRLRWGATNLSGADQFPVYAVDSTKCVEIANGSEYVMNAGVITVNNMTNGSISISDFEKELTFNGVSEKRYYANKGLSTAIDVTGAVKDGNYLVVEKENGDIFTYRIADVNVSDDYIRGSFVLKSGDEIIDVENTSITPGTYTLSFETADNNNISGDVMVFVAAYNGNKLVYCDLKPAALAYGVNNVSFDGRLTVPESGVTMVKAFVWDSSLISQIQKCSVWD